MIHEAINQEKSGAKQPCCVELPPPQPHESSSRRGNQTPMPGQYEESVLDQQDSYPLNSRNGHEAETNSQDSFIEEYPRIHQGKGRFQASRIDYPAFSPRKFQQERGQPSRLKGKGPDTETQIDLSLRKGVPASQRQPTRLLCCCSHSSIPAIFAPRIILLHTIS